MPTPIEIYGSTVYLPDINTSEIEDWGHPNEPSEQYWRKRPLPAIFDVVKYDDDGNAILNTAQLEYAKQEAKRCKEGFTFLNNGVPTQITGKNYFYLQYWILEDDIPPDYRDADRRYFWYLNHWEQRLWCIGIGRGKKRREGASSQSTSNLIYECVFYTNSNCGLVSKTNIDSRDTFTDMVSFGYNQLPVFLKPRQLNRADSVTELVFAAKIKKGEPLTKGQRSKVNYRAPVENAYDRGRISRILADEGGKWPLDVKFTKFISKVSKTMIKGGKRVGFCEAPSTVNELTKGGGAEFKKFWDNANQFKHQGKTPNRFVTYFTPSYDNYEGLIDKFGMSVIDAPTEEQYEYLVKKSVVKDPITGETVSELSEDDIRLGAKQYILSRRVGLSGELLEEEIRQNPMTVQEMFEAANTDCAFNSFNIHQQKRKLEENPIKTTRSIWYYPHFDENGIRSVRWRDITDAEKNFHWRVNWIAPEDKANKHRIDGRQRVPDNTDDGCITVDSYSNSQGGRKYGSKACAWLGRRYNVLDPENTGRAVAVLYGRPAVKDTLHEQVMLAAEYHGYKVWYEHTADDYEGYFRERGRAAYLGLYPLSLIDPNKRENAERYKGTPITPFSLTAQLDKGISYVENHCDMIDWIELLENMLVFDPYDRTSYDMVVSWLMLIACLQDLGDSRPKRKDPLIPTYPTPKLSAA